MLTVYDLKEKQKVEFLADVFDVLKRQVGCKGDIREISHIFTFDHTCGVKGHQTCIKVPGHFGPVGPKDVKNYEIF